jgi:hypothetical protein
LPNSPWIPEVIAEVYRKLFHLPNWILRERLDHFIEKNENTFSDKALLAPPRGMQHAGEHFHDSRKVKTTSSRLYLPVAPQLLSEFRGLLRDRDYLHKQGKDVWMYLTICESHARSEQDTYRVLPEGVHSYVLDHWELHDFDEPCAVTDEKAEALKVQYATYYDALLCRLADNLFLEAV